MTQLAPVPTATDPDADRALKAKHRAMWALGDYPAVATEVIVALGPTLVKAVGITTGERVLDVAAGSGNAAIPAALTGADVTASDLTPELVTEGRRQAAAAGVDLTWDTADAEQLPYADVAFDAVISCVGVMFAPHHQRAADELIRVCRPGGRLGLIAWTPDGFVGQLFATMKPYAPAPPPGSQPPPLWGREDHVRELLGDRVREVHAETRTLTVTRFERPEDFTDYFRTHYGPTVAVYRSLGDDAERTAALTEDLTALARRFQQGPTMGWEYLLLTAHRR